MSMNSKHSYRQSLVENLENEERSDEYFLPLWDQ
jgi:hypothetical protein